MRGRRERAAVKRHSENRPETVETGRRNETRKAADNRRRNERAALFEAHRGEHLHNRGWVNPENRGLHHEEWAQEEMAAFHRFEENLRHYHCVICKEAWPLSASRQQIFTNCSRCKRDRKPRLLGEAPMKTHSLENPSIPPWTTIRHRISLSLPSMCHREFGPATLYTLRRIVFRWRNWTLAGSTLCRDALTRSLGTCIRWLSKMPLTILTPLKGWGTRATCAYVYAHKRSLNPFTPKSYQFQISSAAVTRNITSPRMENWLCSFLR